MAQESTVSSSSAFSVTPSDTVNFSSVVRGIYIGVTGDVVVLLADDSAVVTFRNMQAGIIHPLRAIRVNSTGTTATNIVGVK